MAHPGGRPTALTPQVLEDVRRLLPTCLYIETVADFISLDRTTVRKWLKRGAKEHQRVSRNKRAKIRQAEALYVELFLTYKKSLAEGLLYDLGIIKKAAADQVVTNESGATVAVRPGQWQAAAWRAERRSRRRPQIVQPVRPAQRCRAPDWLGGTRKRRPYPGHSRLP